jgi:hypothetical protein
MPVDGASELPEASDVGSLGHTGEPKIGAVSEDGREKETPIIRR